ncbi:MAG TPA: CBS domain-containing protein [Polyangiales bacterium]
MNIGALLHRRLETLAPASNCAQAALIMREHHVGSIVVVEHGRPLGIVTDHDLVTRVMALGCNPAEMPVGEVMTPFPTQLTTSTSTDEAVSTMRRLAIRRLPVVDEAGALVGVITLDDLVIHFAHQLRAMS